MANPKAIKGQGFHTHPERINKKGRPKKFTTLLRNNGYKLSEINDTIQVMLQMNMEELEDVYKNPNATILEKTIAHAMFKSYKNGSLYSIDTLLTRVYGKPKETTNLINDGKIEVVFVKGKTIL
jgi:pyruvate dehydrogenase complex dehydrogenase (E1) component